MKNFLAIALTIFLPGTLNAETAPAASPAAILAMGAYVPTDDMQESEAFYRTLFNAEPVIVFPDFVAFDVAGGWFAIVSRDQYAPGSRSGAGAVPYLQSGDLLILQTRLSGTGVEAPKIIEEPGIHLLKIKDPNGQLIEFFELTSQQ